MKWNLGSFLLLFLLALIWMKYLGQSDSLDQQIAQKIILDIRYFCPEMDADADGDDCKTPVTHLPAQLAEMIRETNLGGVILFAENLQTPQQIIQLTTDLQRTARQSSSGLPLFISIDQEGGSIVRLPDDYSTAFSGNMAIGATYARHGDKYARLVGASMGRELHALGINVNHAPSVDVNSNPENPVINVRAFADNPKTVAKLGAAMLEGMQSEGVIGGLKHFPGHGDTHVDSHSGLPLVEHDKARIWAMDIEPFKWVMDNSDVHMVMTAHIQFPQLDSSTLLNKHGKAIIKPATLSREILTGVLREQLGFEGLIITDALDMDGIAQFFSPVEAVINTFEAGADIALMPVRIRKPADIQNFQNLIEYVDNRVAEDSQATEQIRLSVERIARVKQQLVRPETDTDQAVDVAQSILASPAHRQLEQELAQSSLVEWNSGKHSDLAEVDRVHVVLPDSDNAELLAALLQQQSSWEITSGNLNTTAMESNKEAIDQADLVIVGNNFQQFSQSTTASNNRSKAGNRAERAAALLQYAGDHGKSRIYISLASPYAIDNFRPLSDLQLFAFHANSYHQEYDEKNPVLQALANVITGQSKAQGTLPVSPLGYREDDQQGRYTSREQRNSDSVIPAAL
ncbi:glycoside hydrolase family 3 protein [Microbulbifer sp.]|uniref:glycoside hydrolase family 3 protein n=1 Tax=Microbulbifer sp. TaxID=1908541 RepID=UPI002F93C96A